jgi:hypothetical protein
MARPNLLRIDDLLIRAGSILGLLWLASGLLLLGVWLNAQAGETGALNPVLWLGLGFGTAPVGLLLAGFRLRRRESRAWALLRLIEDHVEIPAADLLRDSDWTSESLDRAIRDLNNAGVAFLVWDREAGLVQDGRLRSARVQVDECGSCGAKVSVSVPIGNVAAARCPYCHDPLDVDRLTEEKARLIDELDGDAAAMSGSAAEGRTFSVATFILLSFVFWPLGVAYAIWYWRAGLDGS